MNFQALRGQNVPSRKIAYASDVPPTRPRRQANTFRVSVSRGLRRIGLGLLVLLLVVWSLLPIVWNFMASFKTRMELFTYPPNFLFTPNFDAYRRALSFSGGESIYVEARNSVLVAGGATMATVVVSTLAAYGFARYTFRGRMAILGGFLAARLLPPVSVVVPLYLIANSLRLVDTPLILIIIYTGLNIPLAVWLLKSFVESIPRELEESARIEGCSTLQTIRYIVVPLLRPGLMVTVAFVFVQCWNEFMFAYMFTSVRARTLPLKLGEIRGEDQIFWQDMASQASLYMIPTLILGFYLQRYIVRGLTAGAIK